MTKGQKNHTEQTNTANHGAYDLGDKESAEQKVSVSVPETVSDTADIDNIDDIDMFMSNYRKKHHERPYTYSYASSYFRFSDTDDDNDFISYKFKSFSDYDY